VDYVLFSDSTMKAATNNQQWYVTISRGKKGIHIFTGDKEQLRDNITRSGDRPLALDAVANKGDSRTVAVRQIQAFLRERAIRQEAENRRKSHSMRMGVNHGVSGDIVESAGSFTIPRSPLTWVGSEEILLLMVQQAGGGVHTDEGHGLGSEKQGFGGEKWFDKRRDGRKIVKRSIKSKLVP